MDLYMRGSDAPVSDDAGERGARSSPGVLLAALSVFFSAASLAIQLCLPHVGNPSRSSQEGADPGIAEQGAQASGQRQHNGFPDWVTKLLNEWEKSCGFCTPLRHNGSDGQGFKGALGLKRSRAGLQIVLIRVRFQVRAQDLQRVELRWVPKTAGGDRQGHVLRYGNGKTVAAWVNKRGFLKLEWKQKAGVELVGRGHLEFVLTGRGGHAVVASHQVELPHV